MNDWISRATSVFTGMAVALSLLAIPTFFWLTRELDQVRQDISKNYSLADKNAVHATDVKLGLSEISLKLGSLIEARDDASTQLRFARIMSGYLAANLVGNEELTHQALEGVLSDADYKGLVASQKIDMLKAATIDGDNVVFLKNPT
ncbi:hypothetical protein [Sulfitobacter profundi]|uniref:Uncharacterized protein n=1 Tax=Sulfitobacter profundi TaxID=2679961 RepID=A0ABW1YWG4_9RHOB